MLSNPPLKIETLKRCELNDLINRRIRYTIKTAYYNSEFWRRKFDELDLKPEDVRNKKSLLRAYEMGLGITNEELIMERDSIVPDYTGDSFWEEISTSGTGGVPKMVPYSHSDFRRSNEQVLQLYNLMDMRGGSRVISLLSPPPYASGILARSGAMETDVHYLDLGPMMPTELLWPQIKRFKPTHLMALTTKAFNFPVDVEEKFGESVESLGLDCVLVAAEQSSKGKKAKIANMWDAKVIDAYASTEGSIMAYECGMSEGMHVVENRILLTVVDPETKEEVSEGENGVDFIMTLYDEGEYPAMPLIGYSHGDTTCYLTSGLDGDRCLCGRTFQMIEAPRRFDESFSLAGYHFDARDIEAPIATSPHLTGEYLNVIPNDVMVRPFREIRAEIKTPINDSEKRSLEREIRFWPFRNNPSSFPLVNAQADLIIKFVERGALFEGYERHQRRGKPIRLIRV